MMPTTFVMFSAAVVIFVCTCRLDSARGFWRSRRMLLAYVPLAMWALARAGEILHGAPHTWTDAAGLLAVALHLLCISPWWRGNERRGCDRSTDQ
jgi:putative copper export protein